MFPLQKVVGMERRSWQLISLLVWLGALTHSCPVNAKAPRHIRKFDLICSVSGHEYRGPHHPELEGDEYAMPDSWAYDFRYRIDLNAGQFTDVNPKDEYRMRIAFTTRRIITFVKTKHEHETFDLKTRRYHSTTALTEWKDGFAAGSCRFARYSGAVQGSLSRRGRHPG